MRRCALCGESASRLFECYVKVRCFSHLAHPHKSELDVIYASCGHPVLRKGPDGRWIDLKTGEPSKFNFPRRD